MKVHRYPIRSHRPVDLDLPRGSTPLHFGYQEGRREFSAWYMVPSLRSDDRITERVQMVATGEDVALVSPEHVGTTVMPDGFHVFHLFRESA